MWRVKVLSIALSAWVVVILAFVVLLALWLAWQAVSLAAIVFAASMVWLPLPLPHRIIAGLAFAIVTYYLRKELWPDAKEEPVRHVPMF